MGNSPQQASGCGTLVRDDLDYEIGETSSRTRFPRIADRERTQQ